MSSIPALVDALQRGITQTATAHARSSGFCQRTSKLDAATFCRGLILGWLEHPDARLTQLARMVTTCGVPITAQGLDQRFTPGAASLLKTVLQTVALIGIPAATPVAIPLLQRFAAVELDDSSIISLPATLATVWKGCGGSRGGAAALKVQMRIDLLWGTLTGPFLQDGRGPDKDAPMHDLPIHPGSLRVADLSYFSLRHLRRRSEAQAHWVSRYHPQTNLYTADGTQHRPADLPALLTAQGRTIIDLPIELGSTHRIRCRLLAIQVPPAVAAARRERLRKDAQRNGTQVSAVCLALATWTLIVTNAPVSVAEALVLLRARWQIEQLFCRWKAQGKVDAWRTENPWRILCEIYAKLIGCIVQHWLCLERCWDRADRSLTNAAQAVRDRSVLLATVFTSRRGLMRAIRTIQDTMGIGCRLNPRRTHPNTYQLLQDPALYPLA